MGTRWKQVKRITLSSINTLEYLTTRLEDLRESETTSLSQTVVTNLESVMLKAGYDEKLAREWVHMSHLYRISLLGFHYYVGLHTHLWKVATRYLQLAPCRVTDGTICQRDAPDTSVPWDPPPSGVSNLYLPPGPVRLKVMSRKRISR
jgi:hypothetical protein